MEAIPCRQKAAIAIRWVARTICLAAILFVSMFALDAFSPGLPLLQQLEGFIMHLVPSFVLLALLWLAWRKELIGGILFLLIGFGLAPFIFNHNYRINHSVATSLGVLAAINLPFVVVGVLFLLSYFVLRKTQY